MKMFTRLFSFISFLVLSSAFQSGEPSHAWFTTKGKSTDWDQVLKACEKADIVLFGELHNDVQSHWFEKRLAAHLIAQHGDKLVLGCEMLEADDQIIVNEYLKGLIDFKKLKENARLWDNYTTDYKPIVDLAKEAKIPVIATNIPRRYAAMVYKGGFEALDILDPEAKSYIAPLPIVYDSTVSCYQALLSNPMMGHANPNLPKSQASKDATMAHFILKNWKSGNHFYHWNGS
ncbi:MAG: ChaN family lipoprotein [Bacteroidota bacterium]|nr:ChaN family lipoprotein [Bacteroidota bacterium]MDX5431708.1 ChaN family lipoprotein [Bacteroidota bacterium]MDX5470423.1 ChaN family lipoprotein [Bacteroidota bacterium]